MSETQGAGQVDDAIGKRDSDVGFVTRLKRQQFHIGGFRRPVLENLRPTKQIVQTGRATFPGCNALPHQSTATNGHCPQIAKTLPHCQWKDFSRAVRKYSAELSAPTIRGQLPTYPEAVKELRERCGKR
jgi:hypothetical protein